MKSHDFRRFAVDRPKKFSVNHGILKDFTLTFQKVLFPEKTKEVDPRTLGPSIFLKTNKKLTKNTTTSKTKPMPQLPFFAKQHKFKVVIRFISCACTREVLERCRLCPFLRLSLFFCSFFFFSSFFLLFFIFFFFFFPFFLFTCFSLFLFSFFFLFLFFFFLLVLVCLIAFACFWTATTSTHFHTKRAGCTRGVCGAIIVLKTVKNVFFWFLCTK